MKFLTRLSAAAAMAFISSTTASAQVLTPLVTFGGAANPGWRAPGEILPGDSAGSNNGVTYNYLGTGSLERGMDYNPVTGNLILVSRSTAGNGIRVLNGVTGADTGALDQGSGVITGGLFTTNTVGVGNDGAVYVSNLSINLTTTPHKVYRWQDEASTATTFSSDLYPVNAFGTGNGRLGDSLAVTGSGVGTTIAAGANNATVGIGYAIITTADGLTGTGVAVTGSGPTAPPSGAFRLGITFAGSPTDVWGKPTGTTMYQSTYSGTTVTLNNSPSVTAAGEAPLDYVTIGGVPYLATVDINSSVVRVYDASAPTLNLVASLTTTSGTLTSNPNGVGGVAWGAVDELSSTATLYAMSTNQGIQAFTFNAVPEPALLGLVATGLFVGLARRNRKVPQSA